MKQIVLLFALAALLVFWGCDKKDESTGPDVEPNFTDVDVLLLGNWDLYEVVDTTRAADRGYHGLVDENYLVINIDNIVLNDASVVPDTKLGIIFNNNQVGYVDADEVNHYLYDYYFNEDTGAMWVRPETTAEVVYNVDPTDTTNTYNVADYMLLYRNSQGPQVKLFKPRNDAVIPLSNDEDLSSLSPKFRWYGYADAAEYTFQLRTDDNFDAQDGFVINEVTSGNIGAGYPGYSCPANNITLDNFTSYFWRVKADNSAWSAIWTFNTNSVVQLLTPSGTASIGVRPDFTWEEMDGASEYTIQVATDEFFNNLVIDDNITTNAFTWDQNFQFDTRYYWRVVSDNSIGHWSDRLYFTTDGTVGLQSPDDNETEVDPASNFVWKAIDNAPEYTIQVADDALFSNLLIDQTVTTTSFAATNELDVNNEYFWRVNSPYVSAWSDTFSFKTNNVVILDSPAAGAQDVKIMPLLKWFEFNGASEYTIQVATDDAFANLVTEETSDDSLQVLETAVLDASTQYFWRVKPDTLNWCEPRSFTTLDILPNEPGVELTFPLNEQEGLTIKPQLQWTRFPSCDNYRYEFASDANFNDILIEGITAGTDYVFEDDDMLIYDTTYYWHVRGDNSNWSETWSFTTRDGVPTDIEAVTFSAFKIDLSWEDPAANETAFNIQVKEGNGDWEDLASIEENSTFFVDFDLTPGVEYSYRLQTDSPTGLSAWSAPVTATATDFSLTTDLAFVSAPAGAFDMGSTSGEADEQPVHNVSLSNAIDVGKYEVTNTQFAEIMNWALGKGLIEDAYLDGDLTYADDAYSLEKILMVDDEMCKVSFSNQEKKFKVENGFGNQPVVSVTWMGSALFTNWYGAVKGEAALYERSGNNFTSTVYGTAGYRLPTEAEWEYVAKYNDGRMYPWGTAAPDQDHANYYDSGWGNTLIDVGSTTAGVSNLGCFDLAGNAWEWCNDIYGADYYASSPASDPTGPSGTINATARMVIRGSSWEFGTEYLRNSNRSSCKADLTYGRVNTSIGFRVVKVN
jgi:formylglycine-generating enzyme required for sulfatase activity